MDIAALNRKLTVSWSSHTVSSSLATPAVLDEVRQGFSKLEPKAKMGVLLSLLNFDPSKKKECAVAMKRLLQAAKAEGTNEVGLDFNQLQIRALTHSRTHSIHHNHHHSVCHFLSSCATFSGSRLPQAWCITASSMSRATQWRPTPSAFSAALQRRPCKSSKKFYPRLPMMTTTRFITSPLSLNFCLRSWLAALTKTALPTNISRILGRRPTSSRGRSKFWRARLRSGRSTFLLCPGVM